VAGRRGGGGQGGEVAQTMYTHMNKCKNNFKKGQKRKPVKCTADSAQIQYHHILFIKMLLQRTRVRAIIPGKLSSNISTVS
jgi:hypothetical protein